MPFVRKVAISALAAVALLAGPAAWAQPPPADDVTPQPGDRVEVRGHGGQSYALTVVSIRDGVLHGRCLRSGSEFRGELAAISSVQKLTVTPEQDLAPLVTLLGAGLQESP